MFLRDEYELIDFGNGRKLERFGRYVLDRPAPAAAACRPRHPGVWRDADARFERREDTLKGSDEGRGRWHVRRDLPESWELHCGEVCLQLRRTPAGHLGLFPEHATNWNWIVRQLAEAARPLRILNLFAYTGATTLVAAAAGAAVTHLDSARNVVSWARENARLSGLSDAPIRWIADDVRKFVGRELKRGKTYDGVILDPPSYGHGPKSEVWKLEQHLPELLRDCTRLLQPRPGFLLLTCHTPGYGPRQLEASLREALLAAEKMVPGDVPADVRRDRPSRPASAVHFEAEELVLRSRDQRSLPCGAMARMSFAAVD